MLFKVVEFREKTGLVGISVYICGTVCRVVVVYLLVLTIGVGKTHINLHPYGAKDWSKGM